jgi:hypothetical protein
MSKTVGESAVEGAYTADRAMFDSNSTYTHVVILLHGIRTHAFWYDEVKPLLSSINNVDVRPLGYGRFNLFRFLFPFATRGGPRQEILDKIREIKTEFEQRDEKMLLSVIAHSFGTYIIISILKSENDIDLYNLILCGSVLPENFKFGDISRKVHNRRVNDVGSKDILPVLAKISSFGYGYSGTYGFQSGICEDRFHELSHSEFFSPEFIKKYWCPIFSEDRIVESNYVRLPNIKARIINFLALFPSGSIPVLLLGATFIFSIFATPVDNMIWSACSHWPNLPYCIHTTADCPPTDSVAKCLDKMLRGEPR